MVRQAGGGAADLRPAWGWPIERLRGVLNRVLNGALEAGDWAIISKGLNGVGIVACRRATLT